MAARRAIAVLLATMAAQSAVVAGAASAAPAAPTVRQLVVFRDGDARARTVSATRASVTVRGHRCSVGAGTPLAALVRSRVARLGLRDFGSCSGRASDAGGLFVSGIGPDRNRGRDGWVYKVGHRLGTAGAADPAGPFGDGRLRPRARVLWFYCRYERSARGCQRSLALVPASDAGPGAVRVSAYDDRGRAVPAVGATVRSGDAAATAGPGGIARLALPAGSHAVHAEQPGLVRSFAERVVIP